MTLKKGNKVKATFKKYGNHSIIGEVTEISTNEHALKGIWVSIKVTDGDLKDPYIQFLIKNGINTLIPIKDVKGIIE